MLVLTLGLVEVRAAEPVAGGANLAGKFQDLITVAGNAEDDAVRLANDSPFGLTAAVHTRDVNRALAFIERIRCGVAVVNGPTYGSEPHMPFGGLRQSGNGWREAGTQALDVYSDLKTIYINHNPDAV